MLKKFFPIFKKIPNLIFLDNASSTQKPAVLAKLLTDFYLRNYSNVHRGMYFLSNKATEMYEEARYTVAKFINAEPEEIIFTSGTTEGINLIVNSLKNSNILTPSSRILLTEIEHHANIIPWQNVTSNVEYMQLNKNLEIDIIPDFQKDFDIVSINMSSNVTGTVVDVEKIRDNFVKDNTFFLLDAAQFITNEKIDVKVLKADALVFSAHKLFGPTGLGILYLNKKWMGKLIPGKFGGGIVNEVHRTKTTFVNSCHKFEAGTPPIAEAIAFAGVINFINEHNLINNKKKLKEYTLKKLKDIEEITIFHPLKQENSHPVISFYHRNIHSHDIADFLGNFNICVRAGHHCAQILHREVLKINSSVRISLAIYNNENEIDIFIEKLKLCVKNFC